jgi:hypothetical protein
MKMGLVFACGLIMGAIAVHLIPAEAQNSSGDFEMFVTSASSGGAYLLEKHTGLVRYCTGRACFPVSMTNAPPQ